jgi:transglutaminase-like putative cysteine protease
VAGLVPQITREHVGWCVGGLVLAVLPHATRLNPAILVCFGALAGWRLAGAFDLLPLPGPRHRLLWWLKQALALAAFVSIYVSFRGQIGRDAGVALLTALLGLKLLELERPRDFYVLCFLTWFLVVTRFFYAQSLPTALYMLGVVVIVTAALVRFNASADGFPARACFALAIRMVLQALPIMAVAFVLFPRLPGPLWGLPQDAFSAVTGLSDTMTIGHITSLGASDEIAFRAEFEGALPHVAQRYWRGPVLWETDGRTWRRGTFADQAPHPVARRGPVYRYAVLLEPTGESWLMGLDAVIHAGSSGRVTSDQMLLARTPIKKRIRYELESATAYALPEITPAERAAALQLPRDAHPQARELAAGWRASTRSPEKLAERALDHFRTQGFVYTLLPPALAGDPIDEFLFSARAGFCEHYAASFVVLMRAAGVPARVVTGYQGGELNAVSDYLIIRQRDAHAWAEVYLPDQGWTRVDPTSAIAPERLSLGIESVAGSSSALTLIDRDHAALVALRSVAAMWDAMNFQWSQWVLGYTPQRQRDLLDALGIGEVDPAILMSALTCATAGLMGLLAWLTSRQRVQEDPVVRHYRRYCARLARLGLPRAAHEGPLDYAARVSRARPDLAPQVEHITKLYVALRYTGLALDVRMLARAVAAFSPRAAARVSGRG